MIPSTAKDPQGNDHVSELCAAIQPRYHFSSSDTFFEREPFSHPTTDTLKDRPITRFVSLAPHGNSLKEKSIYAFKISAVPATGSSVGTTASPFRSRKRKQDSESTPYSRFGTQDGGYRNKRSRMTDNRSESCFFCIGDPRFVAHLVTNISEDSYLALPKGPLTTSTTNSASGMSFPCHILICPVLHCPTIANSINSDSGDLPDG